MNATNTAGEVLPSFTYMIPLQNWTTIFLSRFIGFSVGLPTVIGRFGCPTLVWTSTAFVPLLHIDG